MNGTDTCCLGGNAKKAIRNVDGVSADDIEDKSFHLMGIHQRWQCHRFWQGSL